MVEAMEILGLDHVLLAAPPGCEPEARRFFGQVLGFAELEKPPPLRERGGVWFALGDQQLHIGVDRGFRPALRAHPALEVDPGQLDALAAHLLANNAAVVWDDELPGYRRFYTADPWGNRIEFLAAV
jgi:catechol 2,3-dioxygenase-like lactoylglutathione lyase family enzyme